MPEEREWQSVSMADAAEAAAEGMGGFRHQFRAEIRHFAALDIVPDAFGRIEVGRVTGEPLDLQPVALGPQKQGHFTAPVSRQVVPDEDHVVTANRAFELLEKIDEAGGVEAVFLGASKQAGFLSIPTETQRCRHRSLIPMIPSCLQDRCLAPRTPGSPDRRLLGEARFILEIDPGLPPPSVFFTAGQRSATQY